MLVNSVTLTADVEWEPVYYAPSSKAKLTAESRSKVNIKPINKGSSKKKHGKKHKVVQSPSEELFFVGDLIIDLDNEEGSCQEKTPPVPVDLTPYLPTEQDSNDPSYTKLVLPYTVICRQRLRRAQIKMHNQFMKEVRQHETFQNKGLDGVRIHREFCKSVIKGPKSDEIIKLTQEQEQKIAIIMGREY